MPDELSRPLEVVDRLFAQHTQLQASSFATEWGEKQHFVQALGLEDEENFASIPCLNDVALAETMPAFSLVRYRCMVQDTFGIEFFASVYEERSVSSGESVRTRLVSTKYRDAVPEPAPGRVLQDLGRDVLQSRGVCYCVPLPGESAWARPGSSPAPAATGDVRTSKRGREEDVDMGGEVPEPAAAASTPLAGAAAGGSARPRRSQDADPGSKVCGKSSEEFGLNFPLPWEEERGRGASTACLVKLYDSDIEALKVCETVEIVGVLCINPELATFEKDDNDARDPSTSLVPRLHALFIRRMPFFHPMFPCSPEWMTEARLAGAYQKRMASGTGPARSLAMALLTEALGGDSLAAEYVLMLLVSRSFARNEVLGALGTWSLNISSWPDSFNTDDFAKSVAELAPRTVRLALNPESLSSQRWKPCQDHDSDRLVSGQLQLAAGTLLMLDETSMGEAQLDANATKAVFAVKALVQDQNLKCDYGFYDVDLPHELQCLLFSSTASVIQAKVSLPLKPSSEAKAHSTLLSAIPKEALEAARFLIGLLTRKPKPGCLSEAATKRFSEDFVSTRQEFGISEDLADVWLCLARSSSLLYGEDELSVQRWAHVMSLERERLIRCREVGRAV